MKLGHVIYKVNDLDRAVEEYTAKGFMVEYGKAKNPYNALIYFAEDPTSSCSGLPACLGGEGDLPQGQVGQN